MKASEEMMGLQWVFRTLLQRRPVGGSLSGPRRGVLIVKQKASPLCFSPSAHPRLGPRLMTGTRLLDSGMTWELVRPGVVPGHRGLCAGPGVSGVPAEGCALQPEQGSRLQICLAHSLSSVRPDFCHQARALGRLPEQWSHR